MKPQLITAEEFRKLLEKKRAEKPIKHFAPELGVSMQFLSKVIAGENHPGPTVARALGYEQVVAFKRIPRAKKEK